MSKEYENQLFTEIFRAKSFDGLIMTDRVKEALSGGINSQNIMLYGPQGTSKTTIARILVDGYETLALNGSSDNGINVVRDQIMDFATTLSLDADGEVLKVVFIDECDGLTENAWNALRETIERFSSCCRFVCTCNRIDKIPGPIKSRFNCIAVYPINKQEEEAVFGGYIGYVRQILDHFNIKYTEETLNAFVANSFPDMRTILNNLQVLYIKTQNAKEGEVIELNEEFLIKSFDASDLFKMIVEGNDPVENYKFIMGNYSSMPDEAMKELSKNFVSYLIDNYTQYGSHIPYIITTIAEYMSQLVTAPDKVLVLLACCFKLQLLLKAK